MVKNFKAVRLEVNHNVKLSSNNHLYLQTCASYASIQVG